MTKQAYLKPVLTYEEQVQLLQRRGMLIRDVSKAAFYLQHINYYRLASYWQPYEQNRETHQLAPGITFEEVLPLYTFDRSLRLLILDAIERVEISVRARWAYELAHANGPHAYLNQTLFKNQHYWQKNIEDLKKIVSQSNQESFILHATGTYNEELPAIWVITEIMTFGMLSKWYSNLAVLKIRRAISKTYGINEDILASWLLHLSSVRNFCAHHARLWNRDFVLLPQRPQGKRKTLHQEFIPQSRKIYNALIILLDWMDIISPQHHWRQRLKTLLLAHPNYLPAMGFPNGWQQRPIWQEPTL